MTHVTEHHTEKEWERGDRKHSWIGLQVPWNAVCVNNPLVHSCEFVCFYVGGSGYVVVLVHGDSHGTVGGEAL